MSTWHIVARNEDIQDDGPHHVSAAGVDAVLVRIDGELRAFEGLCPHQGALLGEGELIDGQLVCRNHRWCFDAQTGEREGGPQCLERFPLREVDGRIELDLTVPLSKTAQTGARTRDTLPGPRGLPIVGSALQVRTESFHLDLEAWARKHGKLYKYDMGPAPIICVAEPEIIAEALRARPDTFTRFRRFKPIFAELGLRGVFSEEGAAWRPQRRLAMRALNPRRLRTFFPTLRDVTENLMKRWEAAADEGRVVDIQNDMMRYTVDVTTRLAFSEDTDFVGDEENEMLAGLNEVFPLLGRRLNSVFPYWRFLKLPADRRAEAALEYVREWVIDVVERTRAELAENTERAANPENFVEAMLVATDDDGRPFSDDVIFGNAMQILGAGEDTTANTMAWAVHLLLEHPEATASLRASVDDALGKAPFCESMQRADELDFVGLVANETMRLKPVAPMLFLTATHDTVVGDLAVDEGTTLMLLIRMPGMDPEYVEDPTRFDPQRWNDPKLLGRMQRSGTFVPFGSGPRICPGRSLALLEIRMVLSMLYRNFEVTRVGEAEDVKEVFGFTMNPSGLTVRLQRR